MTQSGSYGRVNGNLGFVWFVLLYFFCTFGMYRVMITTQEITHKPKEFPCPYFISHPVQFPWDLAVRDRPSVRPSY